MGLLSIGALATASGVPVATLRNWERRYGFPTGTRLPSGHRRFDPDVVTQLQRVRRLMDRGVKPADAIRAVRDGDVARLEPGPRSAAPLSAGAVERTTRGEAWDASGEGLRRTIDAVIRAGEAFDGDTVDRVLADAWRQAGPRNFLDRCAGPLLTEIGARWAAGAIGVETEHFLSERLRWLLTQRWRRASSALDAPKVVCACLPGERHVLGLHLAATAVALGGGEVVFLGADTPVAELVRAVESVGSTGVVVSVSVGVDSDQAASSLRALAAALPANVTLWVGGAGAAPLLVPASVVRPTSLSALSDAVARLPARAAAQPQPRPAGGAQRRVRKDEVG